MPSGDQRGLIWLPGPVTSGDWAPVAASTIQIVEGDRPGAAVAATSVSGVDWNATRRPSGEKAGREPKLARRRS